MTGEASFRASLDLPGEQQKLLEAVIATGKPVVLVLESGRPLDIRWANEHVHTIVQAWFTGVEAGNAIADILFGDAAPSARLPMSWPRSVGQIPIYYNHKNTGRPTSPDRWHTGYLDESKEPLFPFGYGLTYTTFEYGDLKVETPEVTPAGTLRVTAEVRNTGQRAGTEVVQLYVHDRVAPTSRPVRELKGFSRVTLAPERARPSNSPSKPTISAPTIRKCVGLCLPEPMMFGSPPTRSRAWQERFRLRPNSSGRTVESDAGKRLIGQAIRRPEPRNEPPVAASGEGLEPTP